MSANSREQVFQALFTLLSNAYPWNFTSRRLQLWDTVQIVQRPALFLFEGCPETYTWRQGQVSIPIITLQADVVVYTDASSKDPSFVPATQINDICDALDSALAPEPAYRRQTLGGLVDHCRIDGEVKKVPGDIDGDGMIWASILINLPYIGGS
jgi:hypothetical protein